MLIGCTLPQFGSDPQSVLTAAQRAEVAGLDGVFLFDHLWSLGGRDKPVLACWPLIGALASLTERIQVGTLVARVGVVPDAQLTAQLATADAISGGRVIAGLGTGDRLSFAENEAYGLPVESVEQRVARLATVSHALRQHGVEVWIAGRHPLVQAVASTAGLTLNLWAADVAEVGEATGRGHRVTWGGQVLVGEDRADAARLLEKHGSRDGLVHGSVVEVADRLAELASAGATWAVCSPLDAGSATVADRLAAVRALLR